MPQRNTTKRHTPSVPPPLGPHRELKLRDKRSLLEACGVPLSFNFRKELGSKGPSFYDVPGSASMHGNGPLPLSLPAERRPDLYDSGILCNPRTTSLALGWQVEGVGFPFVALETR